VRERILAHGGHLALEGNCPSREYLEVLLDNVEDCAVIDLGDAHKIAHLAFVLDFLDALASHQHAQEMALVVLWQFRPNFGARVEEPSSNASDESKLGHVEMRPLPISWYDTYVFLP
jgi:hypothetical protein